MTRRNRRTGIEFQFDYPAEISDRAATILDLVATFDMVPLSHFMGTDGAIAGTWVSARVEEFAGLGPASFQCESVRHSGTGIGADFLEVMIDLGHFCAWGTCSVCHNEMADLSGHDAADLT